MDPQSVVSKYSKMILLYLLSLQFIPFVSARVSYKEVLANEHIEQKLQLIVPTALLKNYNNYSRVGKECAKDLAVYERGIQERELWALQMIDSSSKVSSGILWGNVIDVGMYDECIEVNSEHFENNREIHGQHCMYSVNFTMISSEREFPFNPILSICLPIRCNSDDLVILVNQAVDSSSELRSLGLSASYASCTKKAALNIDKELIVFLVIMGLYIGFLIMCTTLDIWSSSSQPGKHSGTINNLIHFSYLRNAKAIFNMNFDDGDLRALHGLRALNTFWLIIVHEYFFYIISPLVNFLELARWFESWNFLIPMVGLYCVETFFVLSGFLTAIAFFKQRQKNEKFNIFYYYLHRITRLAPSVVAVLYITLVLVPRIPTMITGPRMDWLLDMFVSRCCYKWPSVLFFFQNLVQKNNYCLQQLWSVSADVQLMWISPFILYALHKKPKIGLSILVTLIMVCMTSYAVILGINKHPAIYFIQEQSITATVKAYEDIYELTYTRASPWFLGIILGYIIQKESSKSTKINRWLGWSVTATLFIFCVVGFKTFTNESYEYNLYWEMAFAAFSKPLWGLIICWIIYSSINYPNEPLSKILSSKIFLPFSRLSYSLCIVHLLFPLLQVGSLKAPRYFSDFAVLQSYISNVVFSCITAFVFSITFELPIRNLEKIISNRKKTSFTSKQKTK